MAENNMPPQVGNELSGVDWSEYKKPKEPHQMSPDEFAAHPYAVFHGTRELPSEFNSITNDPRIAQLYGGFKRHYGTEQAAAEILANKVINYHDSDQEVKDSRIYTYWHEPRKHQVWPATSKYSPAELSATDDAAANQITDSGTDPEELTKEQKEAYKHLKKNKSIYYENVHEDPWSTSLVTTEPNRVKSQADYVKEAIRQGKAHEVHPLTMAAYITGNLSVAEPFTKQKAYDMTNIGGFDDDVYEKNVETKFQPYLTGLEKGREEGSWRTPQRISDYGPNRFKTAEEFYRRKSLNG